jgi:alcohol dehydrogenase
MHLSSAHHGRPAGDRAIAIAWRRARTRVAPAPLLVVVKVDTTTICGTDLHILKGDVPAATEGRILGHEAVGTVQEVGAAVSSLKKGDRVPVGVSDEQVLFLADILPTGYEIGVQNGRVKPGDTFAVVGAGPVGLAAMMTAAITGAGRIIAVDLAESRLNRAREFGATHTVVSGDDAEQQILDITGGGGVDAAIEAVGVPATFDLSTRIARAGGTVANIGVHGAPTTLHLEELWIKNITITTGLVSGNTIPTLLALARDGRIEAEKLGTHHFKLDQILEAYDVFAAADEHDALKVVIQA